METPMLTAVKPTPDQLDELVKSVMCQTDYSREESVRRLELADYNKIFVIMTFLKGEDGGDYHPKIKSVEYSPPVVSTNQEIFRQLRYKMNNAMRTYNKKVDDFEASKTQDSETQK
jgi:hypothetical protein